ncbi:MAG: LysE family translocator [Deltaproteobacteria bacterium]|nr:LysE family translocator [Deltaproteobacteria bacterium]
MPDLFFAGVVLGLASGMSPGPLLTLVFVESLRKGSGAGIRVALAPVFTDAPIIVATFWIVSQIGSNPILLGLISLAGGSYLLWLAWECFSAKEFPEAKDSLFSSSLEKGVLVNLLSPHPYLFWISVGGPMMAKGFARHGWGVAAFLAGFYLFLVGSKIFLAVAVGRSRALLSPSLLRTANRLLAIALAVFALLLFRDSWRFLSAGS